VLLGMVDRRLLLDAVEAIVQRDPRRALDTAHRFDQLGVALRQVAQELVEAFRALVICKVAAEPAELLDLVGDELHELQVLSAGVSLEELQRMVTLLLKLQTELAGSPYPLLSLEMALVRLANLPPMEDLAKLLGRLESLEKRLATGVSLPVASAAGVRTTAPPPPPPAAERPPKKPDPPAAPPPRARGWEGLVEQVKQSRPMIGSILEHGRPLRLEPPALEIGYPEGSFHLAHFQDADNRQAVEAVARLYFDHPVTLRVVPLAADRKEQVPPSLVEERQAQESDRQRRLKEDALNHPALKAVKEIFGGEVKNVIPIDKGFV